MLQYALTVVATWAHLGAPGPSLAHPALALLSPATQRLILQLYCELTALQSVTGANLAGGEVIGVCLLLLVSGRAWRRGVAAWRCVAARFSSVSGGGGRRHF